MGSGGASAIIIADGSIILSDRRGHGHFCHLIDLAALLKIHRHCSTNKRRDSVPKHFVHHGVLTGYGPHASRDCQPRGIGLMAI